MEEQDSAGKGKWSETKLNYGFGFDYSLTHAFDLRLAYEIYPVQTYKSPDAKVNMFSLGLLYKF